MYRVELNGSAVGLEERGERLLLLVRRPLLPLEDEPPPFLETPAKVDVRLPGKGNPNSHDARPVHQIISMIKWIRTSGLSKENSLFETPAARVRVWGAVLKIWVLGFQVEG